LFEAVNSLKKYVENNKNSKLV